MGFSSTIALKQRERYAGGKYYVNLDTKGGWHELASAINPILDSVQYKIYTWFAGLSVGYQISSSKPDWLPEWVQPIMLQLHHQVGQEVHSAFGASDFAAFLLLKIDQATPMMLTVAPASSAT